nr:MAG TPA: hypothetical protein [Caudoviricetes sp.]
MIPSPAPSLELFSDESHSQSDLDVHRLARLKPRHLFTSRAASNTKIHYKSYRYDITHNITL